MLTVEARSGLATFQSETVGEAWPDVQDLACLAHSEVGEFQGEAFTPNIPLFLNMERVGLIRCYTMRQVCNLIGFGLFALLPHPYHPAKIMASSYVFYVMPAHRGRQAIRFMDWCDFMLGLDGAVAVVRTVRHGLDYSRTLKRMGYVESETAYVRRLG